MKERSKGCPMIYNMKQSEKVRKVHPAASNSLMVGEGGVRSNPGYKRTVRIELLLWSSFTERAI